MAAFQQAAVFTFRKIFTGLVAFAKFVVKSAQAQQKLTEKKEVKCESSLNFLQFDGILYLQYEIGGCKYVPNRNGKAAEMERKQTAEAIDYWGSTAGRENLADEGIRKALLYWYRIY